MAGYLGNSGKNFLAKVIIGMNGEARQVTSIWTGKNNAAVPVWRSARGMFVTIGYGGAVYCSKDGIAWEKTATLPYSGSYYITYGMDRFVCVGNTRAYYSMDGCEWIAMSGITVACYSVAFIENTFVAVGASGKTFVSANGTSWFVKTGLPINYRASNLAAGNKTVVCTCTDKSIYKWTLGSDYNNWSKCYTQIQYNSITFGGGKFIMTCGTVAYSSADGNIWTQCGTVSKGCSYLTYGKGLFVGIVSVYATNTGHAVISLDGGINWEVVDTGILGLMDTRKLSYGAGTYVAVTNKKGTFYTKNGRDWLEATGIPNTEEYISVAFSAPGGYDAA